MKTHPLLKLITVVQALLSIRVLLRMLRTARGTPISPVEESTVSEEQVTIIVPVLNEFDRLAPCLDGLLVQGGEVTEILVVDGGSEDGTQELVARYAQRDKRIRLLDAHPTPVEWNGKAWGLQTGLQAAHSNSQWILTIDADVRSKGSLTLALLNQAKRTQLAALSVATLQEIDSLGEGLLHPSLLTTLVYRFGMPNRVFSKVHEVQANGQCFLFRREILAALDGFRGTVNSVCEDITIARILVNAGHAVGFYEAGSLVSVKMYKNWREMWLNWTRSLPMHDRFSGINTLLGWLEVVFVQALPLPLLCWLVTTHIRQRWLIGLNSMLVTVRLGVLIGTARAYRRPPWSYWLSPLCDLPVAIQLGYMALRRRHTWRGRVLVRRGA